MIVTLPGQTFTSGSGNSGTVSSQTAGSQFSITLTLVDANNNTVTSYSGTKTITYSGPASSPGGTAPSYTTSVTFTSGQATGVATTLYDAQTTTITATDGTYPGIASSSLTVNGLATASELAFGVQPSTTTADSAISPAVVVNVGDQYGNPVSGNTSSVTISSTTTGFTGSTLTVAAVNGVATFSAIKPTTVGTANTLTASDGSLTGATSSSFTVTAATSGAGIAQRGSTTESSGTTPVTISMPTGLAVGDVMIADFGLADGTAATFPSATTGNAWSTVCTASYESGGRSHRGAVLYKVADSTDIANGNVTFNLGSTSETGVGAIAAFSGVNTTGGYQPNGTSGGPFDVGNNSATTSTSGGQVANVTSITTASANALVMLCVMGWDTSGPVSAFATATSPGSLNTGSYTYEPNQTIGAGWAKLATAGATGKGSATFSAANNWGAILLALKPLPSVGPGTNLVFSTLPVSTTGGSTMASVVVQIQDQYGNNVSSNNVPITVSLNTGSFASGTTTVNTGTNGSATFNNLVIDAAGSYTMTATASGIGAGDASATSDSFNVTAGTAMQLIVTLPGQTFTSGSGNSGSVSSQTAGTAFNITLTAVDANNNIAAFSGSKTVSYSGPANAPGGASPTYTTNVTFTSGQASSLATTLVDAQTTTITPSISGLTGVASSSLTVFAASMNKFVLSLSSPQVNGVAFTGTDTLTAEDAYGNTVTSYSASANNVTIAPNSPLTGTVSGLSGGNKLTGSGDFSSGVANLATAMKYTGNANTGTFTATAATGGYTGTSGSVTVNPGALNHFAISAISSPQTAGTPFTITTITAQDANNNTVTSFASTVTFDGTAGVTGTSGSFTSGVLNNASVTATVAGSNLTVTVTDGASHTGSATITTINPGTANAYRITAATTNVYPGMADALTIALADQFGNTVTSFTGNKSLAFSGLTTAQNGTHPTVTDDNGNAVALGTATTISFTSGQSSAGGSLLAYKAETQTLEAQDGAGLSTTNTGGAGVSLTISNVSPVASSYSFSRTSGLNLIIPVTSLMASNTDANGDTLAFTGLSSSSSTQGASLSSSASYVFYIANSASNGDTFSYMITNGFGLSATGVVTVLVVTPGGVLQSVSYTNGAAIVNAAGIPLFQYNVLRATNVNGPWTNLATVTAPTNGVFTYTDSPAPSTNAYYELQQH